MLTYLTDEGIDLLRCAIVKQAADDYKKVINGKKHHPKYGKYNRNELEVFFHSSWFQTLVNIDGEAIIKEIKKQVTERKVNNGDEEVYH